MTDSTSIKQAARKAGADLVGIAPVQRLAHLPEPMRPESILGGARSVIVIGHRILRGALRGIEEGTNFYSTYFTFGHSWLEGRFLARSIYYLTCRLEESGAQAVPFLASRNRADQVEFDLNAYGTAAGLGSVGRGGFFLTPRFGLRQCLAFVVTDLELTPDPVCEVDLCDGCDACLRGCPLHALRDDGSEKFRLSVSFCAVCQNGRFPTGPDGTSRFDRCAAGCGRACLAATESKIEDRFRHPFRKRSVWSIDANGDKLLTPLVAATVQPGDVEK